MRSHVRYSYMLLSDEVNICFNLCLGALVALYEEGEKPNNATEFVRRYMGASGPDSAEIESIKSELMLAREKNNDLLRENEALKEALRKYES
jgi:hypothetical protein